MMNSVDLIVNGVFAGTALLIIATCGVVLWRGKRVLPRAGKIPLDELSQIWLGRKEVHLSELAPTWCDTVEEIEADRAIQEFSDSRIHRFYVRHILPLSGNSGKHRDVAEELLMMLDEEGSCPSVVNIATDVEASWNSTTYQLLGQTTLLDHTLNVAEEGIEILEADNSQFLIPDFIVVALAHDIGKLPSAKGHFYALGEHPLTAGKVLIGIEAFEHIARKEVLLKAIKLHHKKPDDLLGITLKRADQIARDKELEQARSLLPPLDQPKAGKQEQPTLQISEDGESNSALSPAKQKEHFKEVNLPWFSAEDMIDQLRPQINQVQGKRFTAFSMSNGYVYVQPKLIEAIAKEQAEKAGALDVVSMDNTEMQKILISIVNCFRRNEMLAGEFLKLGFYGSYFGIKLKSGYELKGYYTPFHAEAFGSIAEMEQLKTGILVDFVNVEIFNEKAK